MFEPRRCVIRTKCISETGAVGGHAFIHVFPQNASVVSHVVAVRDTQTHGGWLNNDVASLVRLHALADNETLPQRRRFVIRFEPEVKRVPWVSDANVSE